MAKLRWIFWVEGQWINRRELCQRTGINLGALQMRMIACRHLLGRFDPELLADPNPRIFHTARKFYESGRVEWEPEELAVVFGMPKEAVNALIYQTKLKLRARCPRRREWITD